MTPDEFIQAWHAETRHTVRIVPYLMMTEACEAVKAGFTLAEIKLVVAYIRKQIARNDGGYNAQSLLWRVNAADHWAKFQERLSLAQEAERRREKPRPQVPVTRGDVTRLEDQPSNEAKIIDVSTSLRTLADDIGRKQSA